MKKIKKEAKESFIYVAILLFFAVVLFINPNNFIKIAIKVFGYVSIFWGIILSFYLLRTKSEENNIGKGLIFILFGIIAILKADLLENFFMILLGGYLIIQNANRINDSISLKNNNQKIWSYILEFSIVNIVLSFLLFFNPIININYNIYMAIIIIICELLVIIENIMILFSKEH